MDLFTVIDFSGDSVADLAPVRSRISFFSPMSAIGMQYTAVERYCLDVFLSLCGHSIEKQRQSIRHQRICEMKVDKEKGETKKKFKCLARKSPRSYLTLVSTDQLGSSSRQIPQFCPAR